MRTISLEDKYICESKGQYDSREKAQYYLDKILERASRGDAKPGYPKAIYQCVLGQHFHLTSKG